MELKGKCKEDFEKWLDKEVDLHQETCGACRGHIRFEYLPLSMQYGVYVDFFESRVIIIDIYSRELKNIKHGDWNQLISEAKKGIV